MEWCDGQDEVFTSSRDWTNSQASVMLYLFRASQDVNVSSDGQFEML
jgi:hypothetical protein